MSTKKSAGKPGAPREVDVAIVGGGPAGCSLAALLAQSGLSVAVIDRDDPAKTLAAQFDGRTTAISLGSRRILEKTGCLWQDIARAACPIETIDITENGAPPLTTFEAREAGEEAFGWIVENAHLRACLYRHLSDNGVLHIAPSLVTAFSGYDDAASILLGDGTTIRARLAVGADGKASFMRQAAGITTRTKDYGQAATVCVVAHEHPHGNIAVEDFRREGPFAILPMPDGPDGTHRSSVVWTDHDDRRPTVTWDDATFEAALAERFPVSYGRVRAPNARFTYPLTLVHATRYVSRRLALVADAAHAIHPIAGQGLNLGLRDAHMLATLLAEAHAAGEDIGGEALLAAYERRRRTDIAAMIGATDILNGLFSNDLKSLGLMRRQGLRIVERLRPAKRFFMTYAMGLSRLART